jgi:hypothetical protein
MSDTLEIDWEKDGKITKETVVFKKITYGELNDLLEIALGKAKIKASADSPSLDLEFDLARYREHLLLKSIAKAPFPITLEGIRSLPVDVANKLLEKAQEVNPFLLSGT